MNGQIQQIQQKAIRISVSVKRRRDWTFTQNIDVSFEVWLRIDHLSILAYHEFGDLINNLLPPASSSVMCSINCEGGVNLSANMVDVAELCRWTAREANDNCKRRSATLCTSSIERLTTISGWLMWLHVLGPVTARACHGVNNR